ncbi:TatD family hydrolase [Clostridium luticellarii]|jgi:TatD DNase family protein|uniref:TatD family hydrolase n=1 Tax=Clostridium luticellarii TaxID=1691940 RepID=UPI0023551989|nr:TatD family hydrolase [Clostridium luticellarii]MCI1944044.1 TatD family hydrolase [Clostridium luticellarii]MCI1967314.1 TatD family hydrolase [Clostridium luticellarii]MCI1995505.1 TatD family hydrolase [Clostridium luticellarii]MCI2039200.1 TatD family hydrolase [Clostridium luticellarii]
MFVDSHNHMDFYGKNLKKALDIIRKDDIRTLGCSMNLESYIFTKKISEENENVIPCFGIHPWEAHKNCGRLDFFDDYIKECKVLGEIGLDYYWVLERERYPKMDRVFEYFLDRARRYDKITNIHTKGAEQKILEYIKRYKLRTPIIHWYSGDMDVLEELLKCGCFFTISVDIGYSDLTDEIVDVLPLDRILTETDGPNSLEWVNKRYGYPGEVKNIVRKIAHIKGIQYEEARDIISSNFTGLKL